MPKKNQSPSGYKITADEANKTLLPCLHGHVSRWSARYTKKGRRYRSCDLCSLRRTKLSCYKITEAKYQLLLDIHKGKCFICGGEFPLKIDHDHNTGEVRALLCQRCNTLVGYLEGPFVERAQIYVKMFREKMVLWQQAPKPKIG